MFVTLKDVFDIFPFVDSFFHLLTGVIPR